MIETDSTIIQRLRDLGCSSQVKLGVALQVYLDLHEVQKKTGLSCQYHKDLDTIYIIRRSSNEEEVYIPVSSAYFLSPQFIMKITKALCPNQQEPRITLAFKEPDSTVLYYSVSQGLIPPLPRRERLTNRPLKRRRDGSYNNF